MGYGVNRIIGASEQNADGSTLVCGSQILLVVDTCTDKDGIIGFFFF